MVGLFVVNDKVKSVHDERLVMIGLPVSWQTESVNSVISALPPLTHHTPYLNLHTSTSPSPICEIINLQSSHLRLHFKTLIIFIFIFIQKWISKPVTGWPSQTFYPRLFTFLLQPLFNSLHQTCKKSWLARPAVEGNSLDLGKFGEIFKTPVGEIHPHFQFC